MVRNAIILQAVTVYVKDIDAFIAVICFYSVTTKSSYNLIFSLDKTIPQNDENIIEREKLLRLMEYVSVTGNIEKLLGKTIRIKETDEGKMTALGHKEENKWIELNV